MAMVQVKSLVRIHYIGKDGVSVLIPAGETKMVPSQAYNELAKLGAALVDDKGNPTSEGNSNIIRLGVTGDLRTSMLIVACQKIMKHNITKDFDSGNRPSFKAISERVKFDLVESEREVVLTMIGEAEHEGKPLKLHPSTETAFDILDAENRKELKRIAEANGLDFSQWATDTIADAKQNMIGELSNKVA